VLWLFPNYCLIILFVITLRQTLGSAPDLLFNGFASIFPGLKRPELKFNHSSASSAHVRNEIKRYTFTLLCAFIACIEKVLPFHWLQKHTTRYSTAGTWPIEIECKVLQWVSLVLDNIQLLGLVEKKKKLICIWVPLCDKYQYYDLLSCGPV
jgi:hypothetical protein